MKTNGHDARGPDENVPGTAIEANEHEIEQRLKAIWSEYIEHQEKRGSSETAKALREKYFQLYRTYRFRKELKQHIPGSQ